MTFLPIVERELRINARGRWGHRTRVLVALSLMALWFFLSMAAGSSGRPLQHARAAFTAITVVGLGFAMLAGIFLTADCLSEERREGTLGLLFLTDLKGYDVVLGKLVSTSLRAIYGLLAGMPVLALPLLLGGMTVGEFGRMTLVLCVTLLLSLSVGMGVSALSRESREAMSRTLLVMLGLAGVLPMLWSVCRLSLPGFRVGSFDWLLWPSPGHAYRCALDAYYSGHRGAQEFWISIGVMAGLSAAFLKGAMVLLPRVWQERARWGNAAASRDYKFFSRFGSKRFRATRRWLLDANPFYWLATRDRWMGQRTQSALLILLLIWLYFFFATFSPKSSTMRGGFTMALFVAYGLHQILKCSIAIEASRRISEDRQSGALELLLVTPLHPKQIVTAQLRAIRRTFAVPVFLVVLVNVAIVWLVVIPDRIHLGRSELPIFLAILLGGIVLLLLDAYALARVAMWTALTSRRHNRAILAAIGRVLLPSWLGIVYFVFLSMSGGIRGKGAAETLIAFWMFCSAIVAIMGGVWAGLNLAQRFRSAAVLGQGGETRAADSSGTTLTSSPA